MFVVVKLPRKTHSKDVVKLRTGGKDLAVHADSLCGLKKVWQREGEVEWTQGGLVLRNSDSVPLTRIANVTQCFLVTMSGQVCCQKCQYYVQELKRKFEQ